MRVLLVEDDAPLRAALTDTLRLHGYAVDDTGRGADALHAARDGPYDAVVLDLGLPDLDGLLVLARLRESGTSTPVLVLTARDAVVERVRGLDAGADDYLVKPFAVDELLARLRALIRRGPRGAPGMLRCDDLVLDPARRVAARDGRRLDLTPKEFAILEFLLAHRGEVVTRTMLVEHVWDASFESFSNVVDVHVSNLRRKLEVDGAPRLLHTVRGVGLYLGIDPP